MPETPRQPDRFPVEENYHITEKSFVDDIAEDSLDTATWWTLHLRVDGPAEEVTWTIDRLRERLFGDGYIGGDSWVEWCEPHPGGDVVPRALHVAFRAPTARVARTRARLLCQWLSAPYVYASHVYLTTAKDWAEGLEIWAEPS